MSKLCSKIQFSPMLSFLPSTSVKPLAPAALPSASESLQMAKWKKQVPGENSRKSLRNSPSRVFNSLFISQTCAHACGFICTRKINFHFLLIKLSLVHVVELCITYFCDGLFFFFNLHGLLRKLCLLWDRTLGDFTNYCFKHTMPPFQHITHRHICAFVMLWSLNPSAFCKVPFKQHSLHEGFLPCPEIQQNSFSSSRNPWRKTLDIREK